MEGPGAGMVFSFPVHPAAKDRAKRKRMIMRGLFMNNLIALAGL